MNRRVDDTAAAQLAVDYDTAVKELGVHLIGFGHRRIAYVAGPPSAMRTSSEPWVSASWHGSSASSSSSR